MNKLFAAFVSVMLVLAGIITIHNANAQNKPLNQAQTYQAPPYVPSIPDCAQGHDKDGNCLPNPVQEDVAPVMEVGK